MPSIIGTKTECSLRVITNPKLERLLNRASINLHAIEEALKELVDLQAALTDLKDNPPTLTIEWVSPSKPGDRPMCQ